MKNKTILKISPEEANFLYSNWLKALIDILKPSSLYLIAGRGTAKTTEIIAERFYDMIFELKGASISLVSDTYVNLMTNILPAIVEGLRRREFLENVHFVINKPPPSHWMLPWNVDTFDYHHTMFTLTGCKIFFKSLDRPSINAGNSVVAIIGDEAKYQKKEKLDKSAPAVRGDRIKFGDSPYFMSSTFCTDMPDTTVGDDDWILDMEKNMDKKAIIRALRAGLKVNKLNIKLLKAQHDKAPKDQIDNIQLLLDKWIERHRKARMNTCLFYIVSSFANADILTPAYFVRMLEKLGIEEFKTAILSMRKKLTPGQMFYANLKSEHFHYDGYDYENFYDQLPKITEADRHSAGLKYLNKNEPLDVGFDAGKMMSLIIGQEQPGVNRVLKELCTITPDWIRELADKFLDFFRDHKKKVVHLWPDRAAFQYKKAKKDFATNLKYCLEHTETGKPTGWEVKIMNVGQGNITHAEEFDLMNELMGGKNKDLPELWIDGNECKCLKSSLELARVTKDGKGAIKKVKTSEKIADHRLPMESTNYSDAFKYYFCRSKYLAIVNKKRRAKMGSVGIR